MQSRKKGRSGISRTAIVVAIIIGLIGLGTKGARYVLYSTGEQQSRAANRAPSAKSGITSSSDGALLGESLADYRVVIENDLLKPLGWQKTMETTPLPEPVVQRERRYEPPESPNHLVLTGITYLAEEPMALIEDVSRGEAYFLREGDKLKNYVVESISGESITLVNGDSRITAGLGTKTYYADGELLAAGLAEGQAKPNTRGSIIKDLSEETASSDGDAAALSIIERMRARRRRELEQE